ncbi:hypothetical protein METBISCDRAFT_22391 [Metschnikowia bicuspidata]|uniref:phosphoinositide 5-phosphatase n=1 Tax=Metschnikowia bicuspidata TaxID=27322 RepID=A0A4P9ZEX0_9ASCO|nr:hypothetical protein METBISCDRAFT_22391 [Metschnikowia bicuspidata]
MRVLVHKKPRVVALEGPTHALTFRQHSRPTASGSSKDARRRVVVHFDFKASVSRENGYVPLVNRNVFGCLGLITVGGPIYLAVITGAVTDVALPVPYETVNRIFAVEFVSITSDEWDSVTLDLNGYPMATDPDEYDSGVDARVAHPCWQFKKLLLNGSFYFSNDFDLTSLLQNRGVNMAKLQSPKTKQPCEINVTHYQEQYMWNSFLMADMLRFRAQLDDFLLQALDQNRFLTTVIRGFAKTMPLGGNTITIISKQSWKRAGTRFLSRGIDDDGYVANFVESEFVLYNPQRRLVFAFTQVRGSVPVFWEQDLTLINPKITVTRSTDATQSTFDAHFTELCAKYNACHIVNLLSKTKTMEVELLRRYTDLLRRSSHSEDLLYTHFDFHAETKPLSGGFAGATKLLPLIHDALEQFGWFEFDIAVGEVVTRQEGVIRVNCLDCLDRTNLIEQVVCQAVVEHILRNQSLARGTSARDRARLDDMITRHNDLWADNGDAISQIYTGTNALKSSFSRSGKMNLAGALSDVTKSVSRMYQNTFVDSKKQSTIDLLLGKDARCSAPVQIFDPSNDYVMERLRQNESTYTSYKKITILAATYNVNASGPSAAHDLAAWLFPPENDTLDAPDVVTIGVQELIELNAGSILAADASRPAIWSSALQKVLNLRTETYVLLRTELMSSMCLFLFVKKSQIAYVTQVAGSSKKTGLGGITANKGACAVRFEYGATSFALVTSHLAAGVNASLERHNDYVTVMQSLSFTRNLTLGDHDNVIWFGDLNYRLNLENERCRSLIQRGAFDELQDFDQLRLELCSKNGAFSGFLESRILFYPTYKFDRGTSHYDTSEKQRVPSWTDRVLHRSKPGNKLVTLNYNSVMELCLSDHKPVYSTLQGTVKFVDEKKKKELSATYYSAFKAGNSDSGDDLCSSPLSNSPVGPASKGFAADTGLELNLLDADLSLPCPAPQSRTQPLAPLPRRAPPPPVSRRTETSTTRSLSAPNFDILSAPLTLTSYSPVPSNIHPAPSNSYPAPASCSPAPASKGSTALHLSQDTLRPLKPVKPLALSALKIESAGHDSASLSSDSAGAPLAVSRPSPPPAKNKNGLDTSRANTNGMMNMSDWKPLVPK